SVASATRAQSGQDDMSGMPGMTQQTAPPAASAQTPYTPADMTMPMPGALGPYPGAREASGTSWQPAAASMPMISWGAGNWDMMGELRLVGVYDTQSGPRGDDKAFVEGMAMLAARRDLANGDTLNLRAMLSPDPFMGRSGYPLLLASGETANG